MADLSVPNTFVSGSSIVAADVNANFDAIETLVNTTGVPKAQDGVLTTTNLAAGTASQLGLTGAANSDKRRGKAIIATEQSTTSTSYTTLTTPDQVADVVLPADGILRIAYHALIKLTANATVAIFVDGVQIQGAQNNGAPAVLEHTNSTATRFTPISTSQFTASRFTSGGSTTGDSTNVTTGQVLGRTAEPGGFIEVFAAAGTYTVDIRFKVGSGTATVKDRRLWVEAVGFA